jgi:hypothetical protein
MRTDVKQREFWEWRDHTLLKKLQAHISVESSLVRSLRRRLLLRQPGVCPGSWLPKE